MDQTTATSHCIHGRFSSCRRMPWISGGPWHEDWLETCPKNCALYMWCICSKSCIHLFSARLPSLLQLALSPHHLPLLWRSCGRLPTFGSVSSSPLGWPLFSVSLSSYLPHASCSCLSQSQPSLQVSLHPLCALHPLCFASFSLQSWVCWLCLGPLGHCHPLPYPFWSCSLCCFLWCHPVAPLQSLQA